MRTRTLKLNYIAIILLKNIKRKYLPFYKKGKIYVCFKRDYTEVSNVLTKVLGYKIIESEDILSNTLSVKVPIGKEEGAIKIFQEKYPEFIE